MMNEQNHTAPQTMSTDMAARMQAIIAKHAEAYGKDLPDLIEEMRHSVEYVIAHPTDGEAIATLQRQAHDMKGQGATFGLTGISAISGSLSRILEGKHDFEAPEVAALLQCHVAVLKQLQRQDDPELVASTMAGVKALG